MCQPPTGTLVKDVSGSHTPANLSMEGRFPHTASHDTLSVTNNVTKSLSGHTLKAGFYFDQIWRGSFNPLGFNGQFDFATTANNPLDTGHPYANAAAGVFNTYTEASARPYTNYISRNIEWFVQDNWRVARRLTLDLGLRFQWIPPFAIRNNTLSSFNEARYRAADAPALIRPGTSGTQRVGIHPRTGAVFPAAAIGALAPGTGDEFNGLLVAGKHPQEILADRGVMFGPRFGFAWDPFGGGKTAVRGGAGLFYNREPAGFLTNALTQQPIVNSPTVFHGTFASLASAGSLAFPQDITAIDPVSKVPSTVNYSFSIQRNIGFSTIFDIAYVGSLGRNLQWRRNLNAVPFGANFRPENADPTNTRVPLPANFLRGYQGFGNLPQVEFASSSNYHSLQVSADRRFSRGVQFGVAYTWSRAMDYNSADGEVVSNLVARRVWNYGPSSFDRGQVLRVNWLYDVPNAAAPHTLMRAVLHHWQLSGIYSLTSGQPLAIGLSTTAALDITGSPTDGARVVLTGDPELPRGERTFSRNFRGEVVRLPSVGSIGNSPRFPIRGPWGDNWDLTLFKNFPLRESMRLQFRWELYNALNHTQFTAIDTGARFDLQGNQVNARLGEFTAARNARIIQFALRFYF
ncbi:MAG: hypothetical protein FJW39_11420 [Acidobacteria bacterium]|nr:hypothetical protein [Acidobacteriota bacterium]